MTTQFPQVTDNQLVEFYLCGLRTGFESRKQAAKFDNSTEASIIKCDFCPGFHSVPKHNDHETLILDARNEYRKLLEKTNGTTQNKTTIVEPQVVTVSTDVIIIRSYD